MSVKITESLFSSFTPLKTFRYHSDGAPITLLDYDDSGHLLILAGVDETIQVYDCKNGRYNKSVASKKYGAHLARFTHHQKNVVYASTKGEHTIRYLSLHDNSYLRYFKGHKGLVTLLEINPVSDMFLLALCDQSVRLWDLRTPNCQGYMPVQSPSVGAFDASGLVFAVGSLSAKQIGLYDSRNYDKDPFIVFDMNKQETDVAALERAVWSKIEFLNDGKFLLVGTNYKYHYVFDAFEGKLVAKLKGHAPMPPRSYPDSGSVSFSPDGRYIFGGSGDGKVLLWDLDQYRNKEISEIGAPGVLSPIKLMDGVEDVVPRMVLFNPKMMMLATADAEVLMWLPSE